MSFNNLLKKAIQKSNSMLCVGLDPVFEKLPERFQNKKDPLYEFCRYIIDETHEFTSSYKPNSAFFEAEGASGLTQLKKTIDYIKTSYPEIIVILDAKRGDIESTNEGYIKFAYDFLKADAITLHPYLGKQAMLPFLSLKNKGCIFLCRTSNLGSFEFQNLQVENEGSKALLFQQIARQVAESWNENNNCMLVAGATNPLDLKKIRECAPTLFILIPGVGAQGGSLKLSVENALDDNKSGILIAVSRSIIYANNPKNEAKKLRDEINSYL